MYEIFKNVNDLIFYVVAVIAITGGIIKMRSKKKNSNKDRDR